MSDSKAKWWMAALLVCCIAPAALADQGRGGHGCDPRQKDCHQQQTPEGGSAVMYLLAAGVTCAGAMFLKSRMAKQTVS
jgi:hypothetical protein